MRKNIRKKDSENLTPANIDKVISLLNAETPITKKEACSILNISYNTTRLNKIIETHVEEQEFRKRRRKDLLGKPLTNGDLSYIASSYLEGDSLQDISNSTHRSIGIIKRALDKLNLPLRDASVNYNNPIFIKDEAIADDYQKGDLVFSARYNSPAWIQKEYKKEDSLGKVYSIWLIKDEQYAYQPFYELADLRVLQTDLDVKIQEISPDEIKQLLYDAWVKARKIKSE